MPKDRLTIFIEKVNLMRAAQVNYFKTRSRSALIASKQFEKEVDEYLNEYLGPKEVKQARELADSAYEYQA